MALSSLEQAIILTISYPDQFSYPVTYSEIWHRLIKRVGEWWVVLPKNPTKTQVSRTIKSLLRKKVIETDGTSYWLTGRSFLTDRHHRRQRASLIKWQEIGQVVRFAQRIPWVSAIFVTGSLAMNNAEPDDDSDFMIVTQPGRLWLTRPLISLFAIAKGKRRSWQGEEKRSWCFNLWIEESEFGVLAEETSLYKAYELIQAKIVFDRGGVEKRLRTMTQWVRGYLPNVKWVESRSLPRLAFKNNWVTRLNHLAYEVQLWYMKSHMTRERVTEQYAFFHPRDTQSSIIDNWIKSLTNHAKEVR